MEDSQGGSTIQNTSDMLPGQENKEISVLFYDPDLLLGSPSSLPYPEHCALQTTVDFPPDELQVTKVCETINFT